MLLKGNCLDTLKTLDDNSIDSIVTDPPYEYGFMGKSWDASGIAYNVELWKECLRVLKPGGHLLAFSGSRTYHRMTVAIEDAGFEIRDQIMWLYGSGFPKSLDVSKAIDKAAGVERKIVGKKMASPKGISGAETRSDTAAGSYGGETKEIDITVPATPEAQRWQGWGTALKPAHEPICVARKPLTGTVASNVLEWGTGALNIDGSRVGIAPGDEPIAGHRTATFGTQKTVSGGDGSGGWEAASGRWPANVIHDGSDEVLAGFPTTGPSKAANRGVQNAGRHGGIADGGRNPVEGTEGIRGYDDLGGSAARFFYCAKASKSERNAGLDGLPEKAVGALNMRTDAHSVKNGMDTKPAQNFHPTVKPIALMRYLIKLVTPPGGTVLDPFLGSGSTAVAAILEGFEWVGCEMTDDYWLIIEARVQWAENQPKTLV